MLPEHYLITGGQIFYRGGFVNGLAVEVKATRVCSVKALDDYPKDIAQFKLESTEKLIPGFIDLHIHGSSGADVMDANADSLKTISNALLDQGVCGFLATTMTAEPHAITNALLEVDKAYLNGLMPNLLGIHLEGPFINPEYMGAQPAQYIQRPDFDVFKKYYDASGKRIRQITIAPEIDGSLELIERLKSYKMILSAGHSSASSCEAIKSFDMGISHCTHLYNAMSGLHHRNPGLAQAVLLDDKVSAELIADGVHLSNEIIELTVKILGKDRIILITDAMSAQGASDGVFSLGGQKVIVKDNQARLENGVLAGSILTMNRAVENISQLGCVSFEDAIVMATLNPARKLGMSHDFGQIETGTYACFSILDEKQNIRCVINMGQVRS